MKHIVSFSSGISSAITCERVIARYGLDNTVIVFMDTMIEDNDNYRFMNDCKTRWNKEIIILTEGRDPYQVSRAEHVIPNSRVAPCTKRLKIDIFKKWLKTQNKNSVIYIGYDFTETHRIDATKSNYELLGYQVDFPLLWKPYEFRKYTQVVKEDWGINPPRMYGLGYTHANCGGRCVKQGQGDWIRTLLNFPDRYFEAENWEREMRKNEVNKNYTLLRSQGVSITLEQLRSKYRNKKGIDLFSLDSQSVCVVCSIGT